MCVRERDGKTACTSVVVDKVRFSEWYRDFHACKWLVGGSTCQSLKGNIIGDVLLASE